MSVNDIELLIKCRRVYFNNGLAGEYFENYYKIKIKKSGHGHQFSDLGIVAGTYNIFCVRYHDRCLELLYFLFQSGFMARHSCNCH